MVGYDSPKMKPPLNNPYREDIKQKAILSRNYLSNLIQQVMKN